MTKEKQNVFKFVQEFEKLKNEQLKENHVKNIIKRTYCPILEKKVILELMLQKSVIVKENGQQYIDMFTNKLNMVGAILILYTNLEIEKDENGTPKVAETYDSLTRSGAIMYIYDAIGENELEELTLINKLLLDDWYALNSSVEAFVSNMMKKFGTYIGLITNSGIEKVTDIIQDESKSKIIISKIDEFIGKL